ncbi:MAG TPA: APC family permease [Candidatus Solibacter sp.]|jgi:amino acid transporter|nr:APC family permease [Candidatus Solibacter sp.]
MAIAAGPSPDHPPDEADEEFLRRAGQIWSRQTPSEADSRWRRVDPDVELYEEDEDTGGGTGVVRVARSAAAGLERRDQGYLRATARAERPPEGLGRVMADIRSALLGAPLASARASHERLTKIKALAVLSSDALSSVAYATEQTLAVLLVAGAGALTIAPGVAVAIVVLLLLVGLSYRQTIKAYPRGGGSYIVASDNLGHIPGLVAGASLMTDYILTVAVSVSAGVGAVTSAFSNLSRFTVPLGLLVIGLLVLGNLRGIREAGSLFAVPTYLFIAAMAALVLFGIVHLLTQGTAVPDSLRHSNYVGPLPIPGYGLAGLGGAFLIARAFASGCTALTGVEAISDGVPAFKAPEWRNARTTLMVMVGILAVTFAGITFLAHQFQLQPNFIPGSGGLAPQMEDVHNYNGQPYQTILSKLARVVFGSGGGPAYLYVQATTALILALAANTSFSDFPRLLYFMARDKFAPSQFLSLGDRLAFSNGIITLGVLAGVLYTVFGGSTDALIPLYTIGVFLSFTLSQLGMVVRWWRVSKEGGPEAKGWKAKMAMNLAGAIATALVLVIATSTKFLAGAWVVVLLIPLIVLTALAIHRHYNTAKARVETETPITPGDVHPVAIVPIGDLNDVQLQTLALARRLADHVVAVFISDDPAKIADIKRKWEVWGNHVPLEIIESPYRSVIRPFLSYLDAVDAQNDGGTLLVVLPEMVYGRWWHQFLHNQTALRLKAALLFRPGTVVVNVPYHLAEGKAVTQTAEVGASRR